MVEFIDIVYKQSRKEEKSGFPRLLKARGGYQVKNKADKNCSMQRIIRKELNNLTMTETSASQALLVARINCSFVAIDTFLILNVNKVALYWQKDAYYIDIILCGGVCEAENN